MHQSGFPTFIFEGARQNHAIQSQLIFYLIHAVPVVMFNSEIKIHANVGCFLFGNALKNGLQGTIRAYNE